MKIKVFYSDKQIAEQGQQNIPGAIHSPSAMKPKQIAVALANYQNIEFVEPNPINYSDFKLCHDPKYVDGVVGLKIENGFGSFSKAIVDSLPYTTGAMYDATKAATVDSPTCALVSGFHHAGYKEWRKFGCYCTFNGLMITAAKLLKEGYKRIAIIDCDQHWGNGTDDILERMPELSMNIIHISFGRYFSTSKNASTYLKWLDIDGKVHRELIATKPDVIIYQAGADVHVDDPYGGILTTEEMYIRDKSMFAIAKDLKIPIAWNLAGGYQVGVDGSIDKIIKLHLNTFDACLEIYN